MGRTFTLLGLLAATLSAHAYESQTSRFLATGAVTQIEGTAGGGIVPMAVLAGYADREQHGGSAFTSRVKTDDYSLSVFGAAYNWRNRIEFSAAQQNFDLSTLSEALSLGHQELRQNIFGIKVRVTGDLLYTPQPQIAVGVLYKRQLDFNIPEAVGAEQDDDIDVYVAASKLFLGGFFGRNLLLNGVVRASRANQGGLVGFGGDKEDTHQLLGEASAGVFLNKHWLINGEYRQMPDNLSFAEQKDWSDVFIAWFPNKQWSVTTARVDLGDIATLEDQTGWYLSVEGSF